MIPRAASAQSARARATEDEKSSIDDAGFRFAPLSFPRAISGPSTWLGGAGNWSNGAMWSPAGAPNSDGADVSVDGGNAIASTVSVDGNFTVGRLRIDAGDAVNILDNRTLALTNTGGFSGAGSIVNNGSLSITTQGNLSNLRIDSAVSLSGSGTLTLTRDAAFTSTSNSRIAGAGTLTNSSTIQGEGSVGVNETAFVNQSAGVIQANASGRVLLLDPNATGLSNAGILRATSGGVLQLTGSGGGDFTNTGVGSIQANGTGSEVQLHTSARISGGTLSTSLGGVIRTLNGHTVFLDGLTNAGSFIGNDNSTTVLSGTINNTGDIRMFTQGNLTNLRIDTAATLTGSGTVTLDRDPAFTSTSNSRIAGAGTLTNASTIQGEGYLGSNETGLINQSAGIMQANVSGRVLLIDPNASGLSNAGVLRATGGGVLQLTGSGGGDFTNTGSGTIQANGAGSEVQLFNSARVSGGTLSASGGGVFRTLNNHTVFLNNLTIAGKFFGNDNSSTVISGTINNTSDIRLITQGNLTNLRIDSAATLTGSGTVTLDRDSAVTGSSNSRVAGGGTLTNQTTIQGEGFVGANETTIINQSGGIMQANVSGRVLQLDPAAGTGTFANQGLLRAINGGVLQLTGNGGGTFNNAGGIIRAEAGSEVQLFNNVTISGGTLATTGAGALLRTPNSQTATLDNLTIAGTYTGSDNSTTILTGAINNTGDITLTTDGNFTNLRVDGAATLQAGGTVTLTRNAAVTGASNARINGTGTLTNASTIQGEGTVAANETTIVNTSGGVIQANVSGRTLLLDAVNVANGFMNAGILRATNGGFLQFNGNGGGDFTNTGAGSIQANGLGSEVHLFNNPTIHGGTLSTSGGGVIRTLNSQSATLDTVTNTGTFIGNDNSSTFLVGTLTNTGDMTFTSDGNFTDLRIDGNVTLTGIGTVTLTRNAAVTGSSNARVIGGGTLTNASTIQGEGYIGANQTFLVNQSGGLIQANVAGRALIIDPAGAPNGFSNNGIFQAINGGLLVLNGSGGGDFNNTGVGLIRAVGPGSEVQLINNATIRGGTLVSSGGGLFRTSNSQTSTLDSVNNPGTYIANDNSTTILVGTINNTGDMTFTSDGNFTNLRIDSPVTLTGSGTVTLTRNPAVTGSSNARILGGSTLTNASTIQGEGNVGSNETSFINQAAGVIQANVATRTLVIDPAASLTAFMNAGTLRASNGGTLLLTGNGGGSFTNNIGAANGTFEALDGSVLQMDASSVLTNYNSGTQTMTGGIYRSVSTGNASVLNLNIGQIVNNAAGIVLDGANTIIHTSDNTTDALRDFSNNTATGRFTITNGRNFDRTFAFNNAGLVTIGTGSLFTAVQFDLSGTLTGVGTLTDSGPLNWTAGTMSGLGITNANGPLNITTSANKFLDARTLNAAGITTWSAAGTIIAGNGAILNNLASGTFNAQTGQAIAYSGTGPVATFNNAGTFNKTGISSITSIDAVFNNSGIVNITSGTLDLLFGGTDTGSFANASGAALTFDGGTHALNSGSSVSGAGAVNFNAGIANFASGSTYNISGLTTINGGTANFNNAATGATTTLSSGVLGGTGSYASSGLFTWSGGAMSGVGTTNANAGLTLNGGNKTLTARTLNNNGAATWSAGNLSTGQGAIVNNPTGRTFDNSFDGSFLFSQSGTRTVFNNGGTFTKSAGSGVTLMEAAFNNTGVVNGNTGTLRLAGGGTSSGTFNIANNALIQIQLNDYSITNGAALTGAGTFEMTSANTTFTGTQTNSANFLIDGGTATFNGTTSTSGATTLSSGTLTGTGIFTDTGALIWSGGTMSGTGSTNANGGLTLNGVTKTFTARTLNNNGSALWTSGDIAAGLGAIFNNVVGSTFTNSFDGNWLFNQGGALTQFNNAGTFTKSAGTGTTLMQVAFTNSGSLNANSGTLSFSQGVQGTGGTITVAPSATLNVSGGTTASTAGILNQNGTLALGSNTFSVASDYTNANFGSGNSFNPRANVTGTGPINAAGNVNQSVTGNVTGGTTVTPVLAFGNFHVGDPIATLNYAINNTGTTGPSLRGARQTNVNGGNITDGRLSGVGVTAGNFGPLALGANTGNFGVTFDPSSAGGLSGQVIRLINNFDNVQDQNLVITGAAFRYASPTAHTPEPVNFGNFHVGDTAPSQALSLTNNVPNDGFSESLNATIGGATGGVTTNGGSFTGLLPGATNNTGLVVGISTLSAGNKSGTASIGLRSNGDGSSNLGQTTLASQTVNVTGNVFRYASPSAHTPEPVSFGVVHIGDTPSQALSITNSVANDGFSERLDGAIGSTTGGATASGSFALLAPGSTSTGLTVGINSATAGNKNGTATITFVSNGTGTSGLANSNLPSQTVNITGQVNFFADPIVLFRSGSATLTMQSATLFTLDFGAVQQNSGLYMAMIAVQNFLHDMVFQDSLGGTFDLTAINAFLVSGASPFSNLAPGASVEPTVSFDSARMLGNYTGQIRLSPSSTNASGTTSLSAVQLNLRASVVPEPSVWALFSLGLGGLLAVGAWRRVRKPYGLP